MLLASFLGSCFQDGSWRPQKLQNQRKNAKNMKKMRHFFQASGLQLWPGRPSSRPQSQVQQVDFTADLQTRTNRSSNDPPSHTYIHQRAYSLCVHLPLICQSACPSDCPWQQPENLWVGSLVQEFFPHSSFQRLTCRS